jgi:hypothetical protein
MAQHNVDALLGWWLMEGQGNKTWLIEAFERYWLLTQPNFALN